MTARILKKYTLHEAALAVCGLPDLPKPKDFKGAGGAKMRKAIRDYQSASEKIERAVRDKKLAGTVYGVNDLAGEALADYQRASGKVGPGGTRREQIRDIPHDGLIAFMRSDDPNWQVPATLGGARGVGG